MGVAGSELLCSHSWWSPDSVAGLWPLAERVLSSQCPEAGDDLLPLGGRVQAGKEVYEAEGAVGPEEGERGPAQWEGLGRMQERSEDPPAPTTDKQQG